MKNFCYWQESIPYENKLNLLINKQKICLLRQSEYRIENEARLERKTNIFCPYSTIEEAEDCAEYRVSKGIK